MYTPCVRNLLPSLHDGQRLRPHEQRITQVRPRPRDVRWAVRRRAVEHGSRDRRHPAVRGVHNNETDAWAHRYQSAVNN